MDATLHAPLNLDSEHLTVLRELVEAAHDRLLVEIRHTHHRAYRDELRHRLTLVEDLAQQCASRGGTLEHEECA
jgi:hypothetical protein